MAGEEGDLLASSFSSLEERVDWDDFCLQLLPLLLMLLTVLTLEIGLDADLGESTLVPGEFGDCNLDLDGFGDLRISLSSAI